MIIKSLPRNDNNNNNKKKDTYQSSMSCIYFLISMLYVYMMYNWLEPHVVMKSILFYSLIFSSILIKASLLYDNKVSPPDPGMIITTKHTHTSQKQW